MGLYATIHRVRASAVLGFRIWTYLLCVERNRTSNAPGQFFHPDPVERPGKVVRKNKQSQNARARLCARKAQRDT